MAQQAKQDSSGAGGKPEDAAMQSKEAEAALKAAGQQNAKGERESARDSQNKAAESLKQASRSLKDAADRMPTDASLGQADKQAGRSVEEGRDRMSGARMNSNAASRPRPWNMPCNKPPTPCVKPLVKSAAPSNLAIPV